MHIRAAYKHMRASKASHLNQLIKDDISLTYIWKKKTQKNRVLILWFSGLAEVINIFYGANITQIYSLNSVIDILMS